MLAQITDDVSVEVWTLGGWAWAETVLKAAAGHEDWSGLSVVSDDGGELLEPWPQVLAYIDSLDLRPLSVGGIGKDEALERYCAHACAKMLPDTVPGSPVHQSVPSLFSNLGWNRNRLRKVLSLEDGEHCWDTPYPRSHPAYFKIDDHIFRVAFDSYDAKTWSVGWNAVTEVPPGSGLFPRAAAALQRIVADFMNRQRPDGIVIEGRDPKRAAFYASACPEWAPDGYICDVVWHPEDRDRHGSPSSADAIFRRTGPAATAAVSSDSLIPAPRF